MASKQDDELAQTATDPANARGSAEAPVAAGATLGRYRLEGQLGVGGMGVVHAAFDPDLERKVALKVLRVSAPTTEAKDRLMREARAMARLSHPNVVTVHEVGTAGGRDFVAMELIAGETLADWLRAQRRAVPEVLDAFLAAGRGLAAAHNAGIVHRDFKPHNVLRSKDGRIVVTDFGLARAADDGLELALETTLAAGASHEVSSGALSGFTATGAVLGTPAYMAPEQWRGAAVTAATDQFAYCVALWEALAGERPYAGPSLDELRRQVTEGPAALDASAIPRKLRGALRRGLAPDPGRRWPSMARLLDALEHARRRPRLAVVALGAASAAAIAIGSLLATGARPDPCAAPARPRAEVWSPALAQDLRVRTSDKHAAVVEAADVAWQAARAGACVAPLGVRAAQLTCLDGVAARLAALREAFARVPAATAEDLQAEIVDPQICRQAEVSEVPRLTLTPHPDTVAALELLARAQTERKPSEDELAALIDRPGLNACAHVLGALAFQSASDDTPRVRARLSDAVNVIDPCGDERLRADLLITAAPYHWELPIIGANGEAAIRRAQAAAKRVDQPDLEADVAKLVIVAAQQREAWDEAFRLSDRQLAGYAARGLVAHQARAALLRANVHLARTTAEDVAAARRRAEDWIPVARALGKPRLAYDLQRIRAITRYSSGDLAGARAEAMEVWRDRSPPRPAPKTHEVSGQVLGPDGRPVAGATVAASAMLVSDSIGVGSPLFDLTDTLRYATSDRDGRFVLHAVVGPNVVTAQHGALRSIPRSLTENVQLTLAPTRQIRGTIDLAGVPSTRVSVTCMSPLEPRGSSQLIAPVAPDGSFTLSGVSVGPVRVGVSTQGTSWLGVQISFTNVPASAAPVTGLRLKLAASGRALDVVVRSAVAVPIAGAQVVVLAGAHQIANVGELMKYRSDQMQTFYAAPVLREKAPPALLGKLRAGDLIAHLDNAAAGELTVCAIGMNGDLIDPVERDRMLSHLPDFNLKCERVAADASSVVIAAPPQQRFE